ncbi:MAG: FHA domain-containing protein [Planctomycetia bacterium]|nr:FHA domain-containing protein [Planctomycetia bacterium]
MNVELKVVDSQTDKECVTLALPATIGRGGSVDLVIAHKEVSRKHCRLFLYRDAVHIQDLQSLNGTYVEGKYLSNAETTILPGQCFTVGPVSFQILYSRPDTSSSFSGNGSSARRSAIRSGSSSIPHPASTTDAIDERVLRNAPTERVEE